MKKLIIILGCLFLFGCGPDVYKNEDLITITSICDNNDGLSTFTSNGANEADYIKCNNGAIFKLSISDKRGTERRNYSIVK